ncbi:MAG: PaaI family thioesterase [Sporomusaceae bacterium]|jgi:acyl-CoA thioesterase|nr:PaaI family thioesterase [Sporomusaceae bacterium]
MSDGLAREKSFFAEVITSNFTKHLGVWEVEEAQANFLAFKFYLDAKKHLNSIDSLHGGVILSLVDTAMGSACKNLSRKITTLDLNINFIKRATPAGYLRVTAHVIHNGSKTMVAESEVYDSENRLIAKARGTFFVLGELE